MLTHNNYLYKARNETISRGKGFESIKKYGFIITYFTFYNHYHDYPLFS